MGPGPMPALTARLGATSRSWVSHARAWPPTVVKGYQWIDLIEYNAEPQKVAGEPRAVNFGDGVNIRYISNDRLCNDYYFQMGETISLK